jgi:hypothetical protein
MAIYPEIDEFRPILSLSDDPNRSYTSLGSPQRRATGLTAPGRSPWRTSGPKLVGKADGSTLFTKHPQLGHGKHDQIVGLSPPRKCRSISPGKKRSGSPERRLQIRQLEQGATKRQKLQDQTTESELELDASEIQDDNSPVIVNVSEFADSSHANKMNIIQYLHNIEHRLDKIDARQLQILQQLEKLNNTSNE